MFLCVRFRVTRVSMMWFVTVVVDVRTICVLVTVCAFDAVIMCTGFGILL